MGHHHSKPKPDPAPEPWKPGNCPTLFECHPQKSRSEDFITTVIVKRATDHPVAACTFLFVLLLVIMLGIGMALWWIGTVRKHRKLRRQAQAQVAAVLQENREKHITLGMDPEV